MEYGIIPISLWLGSMYRYKLKVLPSICTLGPIPPLPYPAPKATPPPTTDAHTPIPTDFLSRNTHRVLVQHREICQSAPSDHTHLPSETPVMRRRSAVKDHRLSYGHCVLAGDRLTRASPAQDRRLDAEKRVGWRNGSIRRRCNIQPRVQPCP